MPTDDYALVGLLVAAVGALFGALKLSNDRTVKAVEAQCAQKDAEIKALREQAAADVQWYRSQLEPWSAIARTMVVAVETLTASK